MTLPDNPVVVPDNDRWKVQLEDWKMAKERISQFDRIVVQIRLTGIPIILVIIGVGLTIADRISAFTVPVLFCRGAALPFLFAALYIVPVALLDLVHYHMLLLAVEHAKSIEDSESFKGLLGLTTRLTTRRLNIVHFLAAMMIYILLFALTLMLTSFFWNGIVPSSVQSNVDIIRSVI